MSSRHRRVSAVLEVTVTLVSTAQERRSPGAVGILMLQLRCGIVAQAPVQRDRTQQAGPGGPAVTCDWCGVTEETRTPDLQGHNLTL